MASLKENLKLSDEPHPQFDKFTGETVIRPATGLQRSSPNCLIELGGKVAVAHPALQHLATRWPAQSTSLAGCPALRQAPRRRGCTLEVARSLT